MRKWLWKPNWETGFERLIKKVALNVYEKDGFECLSEKVALNAYERKSDSAHPTDLKALNAYEGKGDSAHLIWGNGSERVIEKVALNT